MLSANSVDPDQDQQNVGPDLDPNCLALSRYSCMNFSKKLILKKNQHEKLPIMPVFNSQVKMYKNFQRKIVNIFLPINFNLCFGCSKEPSH